MGMVEAFVNTSIQSLVPVIEASVLRASILSIADVSCSRPLSLAV